MAQRLQESERIVADLRSALARASTSSRPPAFAQVGGDISNTEDSPYDETAESSMLDHGAAMSTNLERPARPESRLLSDLSLDERGKVCVSVWISRLTPAKLIVDSSVTMGQRQPYMHPCPGLPVNLSTIDLRSWQLALLCQQVHSSRGAGKNSPLGTPPCKPGFLIMSSQDSFPFTGHG
jgi:hypothetical protein